MRASQSALQVSTATNVPCVLQRLAKVRLGGALLFRCECGSGLGEVGASGLDERLDGSDDAGCGLALEGLGFECLHDKGEDLGGL